MKKGSKHKLSSRLKISKFQKEHNIRYWSGKKRPSSTKLKISEAAKGRKRSLSTKQKISETMKRKMQDPEERKKHGHVYTKKDRKLKSIAMRKVNTIKHHKYLKQYSDEVIIMSKGQHRRLHFKLYDYVVEEIGKEFIDRYISWFENKFRLR